MRQFKVLGTCAVCGARTDVHHFYCRQHHKDGIIHNQRENIVRLESHNKALKIEIEKLKVQINKMEKKEGPDEKVT
jgi:hypothetical protein